MFLLLENDGEGTTSNFICSTRPLLIWGASSREFCFSWQSLLLGKKTAQKRMRKNQMGTIITRNTTDSGV